MRRLKILVVDDEPGVRDCAARMLQYQGCEVHSAKNAEEAWAALRGDWRYDVILMDLVLPDIDGLRLIREMQAADSSLRFVVISGKMITPVEQTDLASLSVRVCAKPFRNQELFQSVKDTVLQGQPELEHAHA